MNVIRKIGFPDGDGAIRTPCRQNLDGEALIFCKLHMVFQGIYRIIRGTEQGDVGAFNDGAGTHGGIRKLFITKVPDLLCRIFIQNAVIVKVTL